MKTAKLTDRTLPASSSRGGGGGAGGGGGGSTGTGKQQSSSHDGTPKARQGCWTCKRRKIGCDRELPACNNCLRTGRECLGYGIRLVWPDRPDGRRKLQKLPTQLDASLNSGLQLAPHQPHYGQQFLNLTFEDLSLSRQDVSAMKLHIQPPYSRPGPGLSSNPDLKEVESQLLTYYEQRIARMVSTVDSKNGFRLELLPMALSAASIATSGLLNAIMALSAFHRYGAEAALPYKANALRSLSASLAQEPPSNPATVDAQLATSMMLCVYNVFDEAEGYWHLHLNGARNLIHRAAKVHGGRLDYSFLYTWFLYHEVLGAFSQPPRRRLEGPTSLELIQGSGFDNAIIIGSLGCSVEVMEIIHHVNELRPLPTEDPRDRRSPEVLAEAQQAKSLEDRLLNLTQTMDPQDFAHHSPKERTKVMTTAELYRVATLLYLRRTSPAGAGADHRSVYLEQAFQLLGGLEVCTSPWPLFVIACETETDEQRINILRTLDLMDQARKIGNVFVLRNIIESFWKQQDLQADSEKPKQIKWWELVTFDTAAPWFI